MTTTITVYGSRVGTINGGPGTWATARSTSRGDDSGDPTTVGTYNTLFSYTVNRGYIRFNTSVIGASNRVVSVRMNIYNQHNVLYIGVTLKIVKYNFSGKTFHDNREEMYDAVLNSQVETSDFGLSTDWEDNTGYYSGYLDNTWINTSGYTYYAFSCLADIDNTAPLLYPAVDFEPASSFLEIVIEPIISSPSSNAYSGGPMMF
jgi:hypothetical protein